MKITIQRSTLLNRLKQVAKAIGKSLIPILSGVLVESANGRLTLTAGDGVNEIKTTFTGHDEHTAGAAVIPAKKLLEVIDKMPDKPIDIEVGDGQTTVKCGKTKVTLPALDPTEYPISIHNYSEVIHLSAEQFGQLASVSFAASTNENMPVLTGAYLVMTDGAIAATATDRHRLAKQQTAATVTDGTHYIVPTKILDEVAKTKADVEIRFDESAIQIQAGDYIYTSRLLEGTYPDTSRLTTTSVSTIALVDTAELLQALELADRVSDDKTKIVRLHFTNNTLQISAKDDSSGMEETLAAEIKGGDLALAANTKYLIDAIKTIDSERTEIDLSSANSPMIIRAEADTDGLHLVLPYRTGV